MLNRTPGTQKRNITGILIFGGFIVVAIAVIYIIFTIVPSLLMNRPEKSETENGVAPKRRAQRINLYIQSNVSGAEVYLKGENVEKEGVTASTDKKANFFELRPGKYEIRLKKEGYQEAVKQIEITGESFVENIQIDMTKG